MGFSSMLWGMLVCFSTSFLITQAHITDWLRFNPSTGMSTWANPLFRCIMCVGFWVGIIYFKAVKDLGFIDTLEAATVSSVFNYYLYAMIEWIERH